MAIIRAFVHTLNDVTAGQSRQALAHLFEAASVHPRRPRMKATLGHPRRSRPPLVEPSWSKVEKVAALLGIDDALAQLNPFSMATVASRRSPVLAALEARYQQTCRFDDGRGGFAVVPRPVLRPEPSLSASQWFANVMVVPEAHAAHAVLRPWPGGPTDWRGQGQASGLRVACLPFMEAGEVSIARHDEAGKTWYSFTPRAGLRDRVPSALATLDDSGAHIAVVPELTLDDAILDAWQGAIRATAAGASDTGALRLVMVGTGPIGRQGGAFPPNRAVLLDRLTGDMILAQDKQADYTMTYGDLAPWDSGGVFGAPRSPAAHEQMAEGTRLVVLEHPPVRLAVLVCEDLRSDGPLLERARAWGVTHILAPVLSPPLLAGKTTGWGWEAASARSFARCAGCHVVVSNSRAHPDSRTHPDGTPRTAPVTSLAYSPSPSLSPYSRPTRFSVARARGPLAVGTFELV